MAVAVRIPRNDMGWELIATGHDGSTGPPFCAEILGRGGEWRWQRMFIKTAGTAGDWRWKSSRTYPLRARLTPYLLDIRHEVRGYYCLYCDDQYRPQLVEITEDLLRGLVEARAGNAGPETGVGSPETEPTTVGRSAENTGRRRITAGASGEHGTAAAVSGVQDCIARLPQSNTLARGLQSGSRILMVSTG
jgi:hypothetical protein